jgi:hypothetical protein
MDDYIVIGLIILIIGGALFYIIRAKKNGQKCIGCPHSKTCNMKSCCDKNGIKEYYKQVKENDTL